MISNSFNIFLRKEIVRLIPIILFSRILYLSPRCVKILTIKTTSNFSSGLNFSISAVNTFIAENQEILNNTLRELRKDKQAWLN